MIVFNILFNWKRKGNFKYKVHELETLVWPCLSRACVLSSHIHRTVIKPIILTQTAHRLMGLPRFSQFNLDLKKVLLSWQTKTRYI